MPDRLNPGPPLEAGDEFCPCQPPSASHYLKAISVALLVVLGGAITWVAVTVATGRLWGLAMVAMGLAAGWLINWSAGRLRSVALGVIASITTVLASLGGYMLLWLPFLDTSAIDHSLSWEHLILAALAVFVAYRMAAPKSNVHSLL